jgi:hypothetical protein
MRGIIEELEAYAYRYRKYKEYSVLHGREPATFGQYIFGLNYK